MIANPCGQLTSERFAVLHRNLGAECVKLFAPGLPDARKFVTENVEQGTRNPRLTAERLPRSIAATARKRRNGGAFGP